MRISDWSSDVCSSDLDRGVAYGLIRYCPICDAYEVRGKRVAVLGCSEHGAAEAMFVRHYSESVTLLTQEVSQLSKTESTDLTQNGIIIKQVPVRDYSVNDQDIGVTLADGQYMQFDTLYVALRSEEHTYELQSLMRISYAV